MSISSRINSIEEHIGDIYDTLELGGADLTNTDKNLVNVKPILKQKYLDYMNNGTQEIWNNWEKVTGTGENVTLNNTVQAPMDLGVGGNTSQVQYSGKNKFNINQERTDGNATSTISNNALNIVTNGAYGRTDYLDISVTKNQANILTFNWDSSIALSGTDGRVYIYSGSQVGTLLDYVNLTGTSGTISKTFAPTTDSISIRISPNNTGETKTVTMNLKEIMISTTGGAYEPYCGGTPSPNPSYPQAISNVTGDVEVLVQNKNLLDLDNINTTLNGVLYTSQSNGALLCNGTKYGGSYQNFTNNIIHLIPGTYTCVSKLISGSITKDGSATYPDIYLIGESSIYVGYGFGRNTTMHFTVNKEGDYYFRLGIFSDNVVFNNALVVTQIEQGSTATTYTPHKEQILPLTLGTIELCKIGTAQDYFYKENSKWYLYKAVRHISLNIIDMDISDDYPGWNNVEYLNIDYPNQNTPTFPTANIMSNIGGTNVKYGLATTYSSSKLLLNKGGWNLTQTQWKTNYPDLVLEFYYALSTPTSTEITDTTLINQLDAISNATSYNEQTNISGSSDELNPIFTVVALKNI